MSEHISAWNVAKIAEEKVTEDFKTHQRKLTKWTHFSGNKRALHYDVEGKNSYLWSVVPRWCDPG